MEKSPKASLNKTKYEEKIKITEMNFNLVGGLNTRETLIFPEKLFAMAVTAKHPDSLW